MSLRRQYSRNGRELTDFPPAGLPRNGRAFRRQFHRDRNNVLLLWIVQSASLWYTLGMRIRKKYNWEYEELKVIGQRSKYRYRGKWYKIDLPDDAYRKFWMRQLFMVIIMLGCLILAGLFSGRGGYHVFSATPYMISVVFVGIMLLEAAFCPLKNKRMEHRIYDECFGRQRILVLIAPPLLFGTAGCSLAAFIMDSRLGTAGAWIHILLILAAAAISLPLMRMVRSLPVSLTDPVR